MTRAAAREWQVRVGAEVTAAEWTPSADARSEAPVFVCAHGAGGHMADRSMTAIEGALNDRGIGVLRFNFLYRARGQARRDPMPGLLACFEAVLARAREELDPATLVIGGRSMGGRAASVLASRGTPCDGLLLLAYPLHQPGQPEKLRIAHLGAVAVPVLCINGTRDAFCGRTLMERTLAGLGPGWRMHWLDGADHGFHVLKASGRTDADVLAEAADVCRAWVSELGRERRPRE